MTLKLPETALSCMSCSAPSRVKALSNLSEMIHPFAVILPNHWLNATSSKPLHPTPLYKYREGGDLIGESASIV